MTEGWLVEREGPPGVPPVEPDVAICAEPTFSLLLAIILEMR